MRHPIRTLLLTGAALATATAAAAAPRAHRFHADHVLGTSLDVTAVTASSVEAARAAQAAKAEILRLDAVLSGWRADGGVARLNRGEAVAAPELAEVLALAADWRTRTGGAFDERLGRIAAARRAGDAPAVQRAVHDLRAGAFAYDLDGVAKGYVIDRALAAARRAAPGARGLMVDLGGDLRCTGEGPEGGAWRVDCGGAVLRLAEGAVATSGAGERDLPGADGARASHLWTPATATPAPYLRQAVVRAPCAADADALATALCVMPPAEGLALVARLPGVEARLVDATGAAHASAGWDAVIPRLMRTAAPAAWPADAQVTVAYEVPKIEAPKYYAPYIAIWITDADHALVKTLTLLGQKPRYLESNYVWWRRYGRKAANVDALTRPTRLPGRYTATWDGSTDAGAKAAPGRYTVHVEAARQDGGHTYESLEVTVGAGGVTTAAAPAKDELGAVKVSVGRGGRPA